jgi:hypothetical protein
MNNGNIPIIGGKKTPQEIVAKGQQIIICYMDGNAFTWIISNEIAARISKADLEVLVSQFRESFRITAAQKGNLL